MANGFGVGLSDMDFDGLIAREWVVSNGIGGYASSTIPSLNTRRYHGLLVAAMTPPVRRMVLLARVEETLFAGGREALLACNEYPGTIHPRGHQHLRAFNPEPFPRWAYQGDGWTIEKQLRLVRGENTVLLSYVLLGGDRAIDLDVRPLIALRPMHELSYQWNGKLWAEERSPGHHRIPATRRTPEVFFAHDGAFERSGHWYLNQIYRRDVERGYSALEDIWSPGVVRLRLAPGVPAHFACSSEPIELEQVVDRAKRQCAPENISFALPAMTIRNAHDKSGVIARDADLEALLRAADQFVLATPQGESLGAAAQYHWSPPGVRAVLAGFTGLFLVPRRFADARSLLLSLVPRIQGGLLPCELSEDGSPPVYGGADIALWFIHAVHRYLAYSHDETTVRSELFDAVLRIIDGYQRGTALGVHIDGDGLLVTRHAAIGTSWMNCRAGDGLVTPRSGRAVELNALWYNALCAAAEMCRRFDGADVADRLAAAARAACNAFNRRFWNDEDRCCFDVVGDDGADRAIRPNQLLAVSLPFPILAADLQAAVVERMREELLTPYGVRTLSPHDPGYYRRYAGNEQARERAMHNGPAFAWLLGPMVTAHLRVHGSTDATRAEARRIIDPCIRRLRTDGLGQLNELFDGDPPHRPAGAIASPLAVAEILRCYVEDVLGTGPTPAPSDRPTHADPTDSRDVVLPNAD